jgi:hypothetical protein
MGDVIAVTIGVRLPDVAKLSNPQTMSDDGLSLKTRSDPEYRSRQRVKARLVGGSGLESIL